MSRLTSKQQSTSVVKTSTNPIWYPEGCKEVHENMHLDELIRRLKVLAFHFQGMSQEENAYDEYVPLCLHLAEEGFLSHKSKDVRLLIACCIADILRIYAPQAPYKDSEQTKIILRFLIGQLEGLKDPKQPAFNRYFYLLENLAFVKSFNMCFNLDDQQEIICTLFDIMFEIVNEEHSNKVKSFMLDILCPLVSECDDVSNELLNLILRNIVEPKKSANKNAFLLAKELIIKCSETIEPYIQNFFNQVLVCGQDDSDLFIVRKVYDIIYELNDICPNILTTVLPQLEYKLKSSDEMDRLGSVSLLAKMFSEKKSFLAANHSSLWEAFLGRFKDISTVIRIKCVQYCMHFLINHPELRKDIINTLALRQHDGEESVRFEVVKAIVATAKLDFAVVSKSEDLLNFVKERTLDKKFKIRREALQGLAFIYKKHFTEDDIPEATREAVTWIKDKILHSYYMTSVDDRILTERLLNTCLVPFQMESRDRMMKLLYLYVSIDSNATKAFFEIQNNLTLVRRHVSELLKCIRNHKNDKEYERLLDIRISQLTKYLPDPVKASEFFCKFSLHLRDDPNLYKAMELIVDSETDNKSCAENTNIVLKKLGPPIMTNLYHNTIKLLLERTSSVLVDKESISKLLLILHDIVIEKKKEILDCLRCDREQAISRGLKLICVLAFVFPAHFDHGDSLEMLIQMMSHVSEDLQPQILIALTYIGKSKSMWTCHQNLLSSLVPKCANMILTGTPKQGKEAVRCLHVNMKESDRNHTFSQLVETLRGNLDPKNSNYRTAIVALGHIALLMPEEFKHNMKIIISLKIVKELLVNPKRTEEDSFKNSEDWCDEEELPEITRSMMAGMKFAVRWLLGLKDDLNSATKTFKMLTAFIETGGGFIKATVSFSDAEKSWLRVTAGCCMLKICEQKGVGDQFTALQFYSLSKLMNDDVLQVRSRFAMKLHCGLGRGIPHKCLPLDFMGFYALAGYETDKSHRSTVKDFMISNVNKRRDYVKILMVRAAEKAAIQLPHIMPDYMLVFSVAILSHNPKFTDHNNLSQLAEIKECLWYILEPLIRKNDDYSFGFYKTLAERIKNHTDAVSPDNDDANSRIYVICDIALDLILQRSTSFEMKDYPSEPRIPPMYFKRHEDPFYFNAKSYLPQSMKYAETKKVAITASVVPAKSSRRNKGRNAVIDKYRSESIDTQPSDPIETRMEIPGIKSNENEGGPVRNLRSKSLRSKTTVPSEATAKQLKSKTESGESDEQDDDAEPPRKSARKTSKK